MPPRVRTKTLKIIIRTWKTTHTAVRNLELKIINRELEAIDGNLIGFLRKRIWIEITRVQKLTKSKVNLKVWVWEKSKITSITAFLISR